MGILKDDALGNFVGKVWLAFVLFIVVLITGTAGYWLVSGGTSSIIDCLYMTVITLATVGYGEIIDLSSHPAGRVFTMVLIVVGMGVITYFFSTVTAFVIEGNLRELYWRKKMRKLIAAMKGHYIVCGAGTMGVHVIDEMLKTHRKVVAIDADPARIDAMKERSGYLGLIAGDAAENEVLMDAGIERAAGIVVATKSDKDNMVITISARQIAPAIRIITRCSDIRHQEKLSIAGADKVVSSNLIGGLRLASEMVRPSVTNFLDRMLREGDASLRIEEVAVAEGAPIAGRRIDEVRRSVLVLSVRAANGDYKFNPPGEQVLAPGDTLIFMGSADDREALGRA